MTKASKSSRPTSAMLEAQQGSPSLRNMMDETFSNLENNINDILAFEEQSAEKQTAFRKARRLFASPSERAVMNNMASEKALGEIQRLSTQFEEAGEISELQQELERATNDYEVFGEEPPFGIERFKSPPNSKRVSFVGGKIPEVGDDGEALRVAIKERLDFFESTLTEHTKDGSRNVSDGSADMSNSLEKHRSLPSDPPARIKRLKDAFKRAMDWLRKRVEAFVASFTPKDKMVTVTEMG
eukprot:scaffold692_cov118-Cylindrotheca_fusiformis.AAC.11